MYLKINYKSIKDPKFKSVIRYRKSLDFYSKNLKYHGIIISSKFVGFDSNKLTTISYSNCRAFTSTMTNSSFPRDNESKNQSIRLRLKTGLVMGLLGVTILVSGGWFFTFAIASLSYQALQEYFGLIIAKNVEKDSKPIPEPVIFCVTLACIFQVMSAQIIGEQLGQIQGLAGFVILATQLFLCKEMPSLNQLLTSIFAIFYCGLLPSFWVKLRLLGPTSMNLSQIPRKFIALGPDQMTIGFVFTTLSAACIVAADISAYFVGKSFGRNKLSKISPNKTIEGAVAGLLACSLIAILLGKFLIVSMSTVGCLIFGISVFFTSLTGDLIESALKRDTGFKDSGNLIPGHGGLLDRIDSYLFTGVVVYTLVLNHLV